MYKIAEEKINQGLSLPARLILGLISAIFGVLMVLVLVAPPSEKAIYFYAFGVFCALISIACFTKGRIRQFIGSAIGCALILLSGWYLYSQLTDGSFISGSRCEPSVKNAISFFIAFGIPGAVYAIKTKFGWRQKKSKQP